jgi:hypothetical protein
VVNVFCSDHRSATVCSKYAVATTLFMLRASGLSVVNYPECDIMFQNEDHWGIHEDRHEHCLNEAQVQI